jgi:S-adenosylmethionine/arginine decarboxylase-like enzyme
MKPYGEPQVVMFGEGNKRGYTLIQLIETSNIAGHFCEESNNAYLDVFSCKPFDYATVEAVVGQYFDPERIQAIELRRDADRKGIPWVDRIFYRELT